MLDSLNDVGAGRVVACPGMSGLTPEVRGDYAKHNCPLDQYVRPGREGRALQLLCESENPRRLPISLILSHPQKHV